MELPSSDTEFLERGRAGSADDSRGPLREARRERRINADALWRYARVDRVANVMRPYLEATA